MKTNIKTRRELRVMFKWAIRQALSNNVSTNLSVSDIKSEAEYAFMEIKEEGDKSVCISNSSINDNKIEAHVFKDFIWDMCWRRGQKRVFGVRGIPDEIAEKLKSSKRVIQFIKDVTSELPEEIITFREFVEKYNSCIWKQNKVALKYVYPQDYKILDNIIKDIHFR